MTKESEDVRQLREKLKAIEEQRKRDVAQAIFNKHINKDRPLTNSTFIDAMIEFEQTIKKTGI